MTCLVNEIILGDTLIGAWHSWGVECGLWEADDKITRLEIDAGHDDVVRVTVTRIGDDGLRKLPPAVKAWREAHPSMPLGPDEPLR